MIAYWFLTLAILSIDRATTGSLVNIIDDKPMDPIAGRICGIADMNKDGNTDLIVQQSDKLVIYLQSEQAEFKNSMQTINLGTKDDVFCTVGDFNGDSCPDILVVKQFPEDLNLFGKIKAVFMATKEKQYQATVYLFNQRGNKFIEQRICDDNDGKSCSTTTKFIDHPILLDVNGDGITDIFGFELKENNSENSNDELKISLYCRAGFYHEDVQTFNFKPCKSKFPKPKEIYRGFTPIFTDLDNDLSAEIAFVEMVGENSSSGSKYKMVVWKIYELTESNNFEWRQDDSLSVVFPTTINKYLGSPVVADVDSDGYQEILIPDCGETNSCQSISNLLCYKFNYGNHQAGWQNIALDLNKATIHSELEGETILLFRVGDFSMNGYPDLIATMSQSGGMRVPVVLDNVFDPTAASGNISRKFELSKRPQRIIQKEVQNIQLSAFFDLKEDGNLDILYEFVSKNGPMVNFIKCDDKGDTTFLKVQIFTGAGCTSNECCDTDTEASRRVKIGSGIAWQGACVRIKMADSTQGFIDQGMRISSQCQLPQTSHRILNNPFVLFGLSRSPNFVEEVHMGAPRLYTTINNKNQQDYIRQIVPNSRVIVIPPSLSDKSGGWTSRLYVTPSRLIILSFLVMVVMCVILLILVAALHLRERHQDKKERQAQTHRFHFDAM